MNILLGLALTIHMDTTGDYNSYHPHVRFYEGQSGALPYARLGLTLSETGSLFIAPAFEKIYGEITTGTVIGFEILY